MAGGAVALLLVLGAAVGACGGAGATVVDQAADHAAAETPVGGLQQVAELQRMPSGVAVHGDRIFVSLPRWVEEGDATVVELVDGTPVPYPNAAMNDLEGGVAALHSVNGLHVDRRGWLWMLDNARIDLRGAPVGAPKLVVWDTVAEREVFRHVFSEEVAPAAASFLNDVVVSEDHGFAYITNSGMGGPPSLIVLEVHRDIARRVLEGHASVTAAERDMVIDGETVLLHRTDGPAPWRVAANAIALSADGTELLFGPMSSDTLYAVPTVALRDAALDADAVAAAVYAWGPKPITDGICVGPDGRVFATDVEGGRVVELDGEGMVPVAGDARTSFPVAVETTADTLWFTTNQLHRAPLLGGDDRRVPPFGLWRVALRE